MTPINSDSLQLNGERADLPSLEVTVYSTRLKLAPSTIFPDQEKPQRYDQITYGRNGGSRRAPGQ